MRQPWWPPLGCPADNTALFTVPPGELWVDMDADLTAAYEAIHCRVFTFRGETDQWLSLEDSIHVWRGVAANARMPAPEVVRLAGCEHSPTIATEETAYNARISPAYERALLEWLER